MSSVVKSVVKSVVNFLQCLYEMETFLMFGKKFHNLNLVIEMNEILKVWNSMKFDKRLYLLHEYRGHA